MKKTGAILLMIAICLLATSFALAETSPVVTSGALAAYLDGDGHLYVPGNASAINRAQADELISIDSYRVLFLSPRLDGASDLYMIDLGSFSEKMVAQDVKAACMTDEDTLYYITGAQRAQLMRMSLSSQSASLAYTAAEPIDRLYRSAEGLVFELVDQAGTYVYVPQTGTFESYLGVLPASGEMTESREIYLTRDGELNMKDIASYSIEHIDSGVLDYVIMNGRIYYLSQGGSALRLKSYDPATMNWVVVMTPDSAMKSQLTASGGSLFMLDDAGQIYSVNLSTGALVPSKRYDLASYKAPSGYEATGLRIEGMSGQLNVYVELRETSAELGFSFIEFTSTSDTDTSVYRLLDRISLSNEEAAWDYLKPAPQYATLMWGSRGDAVRAIQQPLKDLGYYDYYVDGIFGPRTHEAVRLLQDDLGRAVNGIADAELQRIILSGSLNAYDPYRSLKRGNRGLRVQAMQERLRDLGFMADAADGIFGANTQRAVQLFQSEHGLAVSDGATRETLVHLFSGAARNCASYIDLYPGNTGYRVRELNRRLRELYYLNADVGSVYTSETAAAVRAFQSNAGLQVTGNATVPVLRALFARSAPEASGYIVLRRGDQNSRVTALQRRLKDLGYYDGSIDGYYGRATEKAVKLFQQKVGLKPTGVATVRTQELLFAADAPHYVRPTVISEPEITLDSYHHREDGVYCIADDSSDSGYAIFSWSVEGEAEHFNVLIKDSKGTTHANEDTYLTRTSVSIATLKLDRTYTLTVTAYPEDGDRRHVTSASIRFRRIETPEEPEPGPAEVGEPVISIETVTRAEDGVNYVQPGVVIFRWYADGEVASYYVDIQDSDGASRIQVNTIDEQASIHSKDLKEGEVYTIYVYAVPERGTRDDGTMSFERFALETVELPTPESESSDTPDSEAADTPDSAGSETDESSETPDPADAEAVDPDDSDTTDSDVTETPESTEEILDNPAVTLDPVISEGESITPPEMRFETVAGYDGDVALLSGNVIVMSWHSEGNVQAYYVEIRDSSDVVQFSATTDKVQLNADPGRMTPGEVYTLSVTAIPEGGSVETGVSAEAYFALYAQDAPQETDEAEFEEGDANDPDSEESNMEEDAIPDDGEPVAEDEANAYDGERETVVDYDTEGENTYAEDADSSYGDDGFETEIVPEPYEAPEGTENYGYEGEADDGYNDESYDDGVGYNDGYYDDSYNEDDGYDDGYYDDSYNGDDGYDDYDDESYNGDVDNDDGYNDESYNGDLGYYDESYSDDFSYEDSSYDEPYSDGGSDVYGPSEIAEVQQKLAQLGYLNDYSEGRLDDATLKALQAYADDEGLDFYGTLSSEIYHSLT